MINLIYIALASHDDAYLRKWEILSPSLTQKMQYRLYYFWCVMNASGERPTYIAVTRFNYVSVRQSW